MNTAVTRVVNSCHYNLFLLIVLLLTGCNNPTNTVKANEVLVVGAMKDVMWKGKLDGQIFLDTLKNKPDLYGLGPEAFLKGELLVIDGNSYTGKVVNDSTMLVTHSFDVKAPFFVYSYVPEWETVVIPAGIKTLHELEKWLLAKTKDINTAFAFKLTGKITSAKIHLQNLPDGSTVSSPAEAHLGQQNYYLHNREVAMLGFFSKNHKGIFTHHDTFMHLHLITKDLSLMGHLDSVVFGNTTVLYLPKGLK